MTTEGPDEGNPKKDAVRWIGNDGQWQEGKIVEKASKLKMTGYRIEKCDCGQDWMLNKRRAQRRPRRPGMNSSDRSFVESCNMD